ncbi:hypothetical protein CMV_004376 [Castanea mollissima]|uniref:Wall-associated receptor kinase galacturonan-binding domain-containing protein n=1 Tax=Castanea mollissima TaxID=60419 RepID=A0A8J4RQW2_9ROSI|nr:hypothetical protein CMV_004376 [Castanea mollissima]
MMFRKNLPLLGLLVLLFALFHEACIAKGQSQNCGTSSCGNLLNISFPFRLKGAPHQCRCGAESVRGIELDCENNRTSLLFDSVKFYVQEIDYVNKTFRLMDASLHKNPCSIPHLIPNIYYYYSYSNTSSSSSFHISESFSDYYSSILYLLNCTVQLKSPLYVDVSHCIGNSYSAQTRFFYAYFGYLTALHIPELCSIEGSVPTRIWKNTTGLSVLEIQQELLQGYEFHWYYYCYFDDKKYNWFRDSIFPFIQGLYFLISDWFLYQGGLHTFIKYIGEFILGRALLGIVCLIAFLIYKFGPRNTFMDDAIEIFLQSHNLMPIRRKNLNASVEHSSQIYFPSWIYDKLNQGEDLEVLNAMEGENATEGEKKTLKMIIVAFWCIQMKPINRPSMSKVLEMLEGPIELLQMPPKPFFGPEEMLIEDHTSNNSAGIPTSDSDSIVTLDIM